MGSDIMEKRANPRRGGRPRADVPGSALTTWIPSSYHDRLIAMANARHMSVSGMVRQILILRLHQEGSPQA